MVLCPFCDRANEKQVYTWYSDEAPEAPRFIRFIRFIRFMFSSGWNLAQALGAIFKMRWSTMVIQPSGCHQQSVYIVLWATRTHLVVVAVGLSQNKHSPRSPELWVINVGTWRTEKWARVLHPYKALFLRCRIHFSSANIDTTDNMYLYTYVYIHVYHNYRHYNYYTCFFFPPRTIPKVTRFRQPLLAWHMPLRRIRTILKCDILKCF